MSLLAVNEVLQWTFIVVILFMLVGVLIMLTDIRRRLGPDQGAPIPTSGLANGTLAPNITAEDRRTGQRVSLSDHAGQRVLVAFMSPTCMPCKELLPNLNRFAGDRRDVSVVVVATDGAGVDYARQFSEQIAVVGDADKEIQKAFDVGWTPLVYLLDEERRVVNRTISNSLVDLEDTLDGKAAHKVRHGCRLNRRRAWLRRMVEPSMGLMAPDRRTEMVTVVEKICDHMEKGLSRRGFLAFAGKVVGVAGMVMVGADRLALTVHAACCTGTPCSGCPNPPALCPSGCVPVGSNLCCDVSGTNTCHNCVVCNCGLIGTCDCEFDQGTVCGTNCP